MSADRNGALVRDWVRDLRRRNLRDRTVQSYSERLELLVRWADGRPLLELSADDLEEFLDSRHHNPQSRASYIAALQSLYRWAVLRNLTDVDPTLRVVKPKVRQGRPRPTPDDVLGAIVRESKPDTRAMILCCALAGMRVSEVAHLCAEDVDLERGTIEVRNGKGGKDRLIPLHPDLGDALRAVMPASGVVFYTADAPRRPFTGHGVGDRIRRALRDQGHTGTAHSLRHWAGTSWYRQSRDLLATAQLMGHSNVNTTTIYAKYDTEHGATIVAKISLPA